MEFKKDKTYSFPQLMAYGFSRDNEHIMADCHLYLGENSFDAMLLLNKDVFQTIVKRSDDKSGEFEKTCLDWLDSSENELFLPDAFPEPIHCKLTGLTFHFLKSEKEEDEFGAEHIFYFSLEPQTK